VPRILIVAPNWVGDTLLAQPLLARLHQRLPGAVIDALAPSWTAPLLSRMPEIAEVMATPFVHGPLQLRQRWETGKALRARGYHEAIVLPNTFKSALIPFFADIGLRVGFTGESRYGLLKQVADLASGANSHRMSFQRYVLATLLEEVLAATTLRLRVMSRSRYEVRRKVQTGDQRSAAGLDLEILDHYTGMGRSVSTLSGGESFLASLALALGLSDVVQSYSGGIRLDAIFVDEGFGTLDPESLDFAISALKDLQQAGRMVGIISHVAELKEWIDARLELKMTPNGSVAEFTR